MILLKNKDKKANIKSGNNIEIKDGNDFPFDLTLYGKSTQATSTNPVSPSPDYPSPIESIEEINIEVNNSNFINANNIKNSNIIISNDGAKITMPLITNGNG